MTSSDSDCRYLLAPGTRTDSTPFGRWLAKLGIVLPRSMPLAVMVERGWITPVLRVALPREPFEAWKNYPILSVESDGFTEDTVWAVNLHVKGHSGGWPRPKARWWVHDLDMHDHPDTERARRNALEAGAGLPAPRSFRHARGDEVWLWFDYFAYWQAFQILDYLRRMSTRVHATDEVHVDAEAAKARRRKWAEDEHAYLTKRWTPRYRVFDWLSRMRTVIGSAVARHSFEGQEAALQAVTSQAGLTADQMRTDVRETLLKMWEEYTRGTTTMVPKPLVEFLRQEIQYAVYYIEVVSGEPVNAIDPFWSNPVRHDGIAKLIDALPHEDDLARKEFPWHAEPYLDQARRDLPEWAHLDKTRVRQIVEAHWNRSRSLRRFVVAFHRLHEQLQGERLGAEAEVIRQTERIEQFNLVVMHAERVLSAEARERTGGTRYPDVRKLAKETLNHLQSLWGQTTNGLLAIGPASLQKELVARAQLHDLDEASDLPVIRPDEVQSGVPQIDQLVAALTNFVVGRNYAAHHDVLDEDLVYPNNDPATVHAGAAILRSVVLLVLSVLDRRL